VLVCIWRLILKVTRSLRKATCTFADKQRPVVQTLCSISKAKECLADLRDVKHVVFGRGFHEKRVMAVRDALGGSSSAFSWYWYDCNVC
jgi:hypothetical protein